MTYEKVDLTGVKATMLVTLYLRALDSRDEQPILGDRFAADAVRRINYDWTRLDKKFIQRNRFSLALRVKKFDQWAQNFVQRHPESTVVQLACGLDSRAARLDLPAGVRWYDVDLPEVIAIRRKLVKNAENYRMIAASATDEQWWDEIPTDRPVLVIAEGLVMYLRPTEVRTLLRRLPERFSSGELLFDGVAPWVTTTTQVLVKLLRRWYDYPAYWTAIRSGRDIERWAPRLRYLEDVSVVDQYDHIPNPTTRRFFRFGARFRWFRHYLRIFRAEW